ncbi:hypothetical protein Tco_1063429 [Tanacetum coccineum]
MLLSHRCRCLDEEPAPSGGGGGGGPRIEETREIEGRRSHESNVKKEEEREYEHSDKIKDTFVIIFEGPQ